MNCCPAVEEEMDEDVMDDEDEPSEESRQVKSGQSRVVTPTLKEPVTVLTGVENFQQRSKRTGTRNK